MSLVSLTLLSLAALAAPPTFQEQSSGSTASLRGLAVVNERVAWASGTQGTVLRTIDGGAHWETVRTPADAAALDFRDLHAASERLAYALAAGPGDQARLYKTTDGGQTWTLLLKNPDAEGFLDAIAFWDAEHGLVMGDPVRGQFVILSTDDGGKTWQRQTTPPALPGEGAFAASGTCLIVRGRSEAWFATGGTQGARIFHSTDRGRTWQVAATPLRNDVATAGVYGLAVQGQQGVAVGGDFKAPQSAAATAALSADGGKTWATLTSPGGYRSAAAFSRDGRLIVTVGSHGASYSEDRGQTWRPLAATGYHAIALTPAGSGWAVGSAGRVARVQARPN